MHCGTGAFWCYDCDIGLDDMDLDPHSKIMEKIELCQEVLLHSFAKNVKSTAYQVLAAIREKKEKEQEEQKVASAASTSSASSSGGKKKKSHENKDDDDDDNQDDPAPSSAAPVRGSVASGVPLVPGAALHGDGIRGLNNIGNTCFFVSCELAG